MKHNHYAIAGLDFIFDSHNNPWFLEANTSPTVHKELERAYGDCLTVKKLADYINSLPGKNVCIFVRKKHKFSEEKENSAWVPEKIKPFINKKIHICYMEKNLRVSRNYFLDHNFTKLTLTNFKKGGGNTYIIDSEKKKIKPNIILRHNFQLNPDFEKEGVNVINSMATRDLVWFKHKCNEVVSKIKNINIPKYFIVNSNDELKKVLMENKRIFKNGYVVKPTNDSLGRNVAVMNSLRLPKSYDVKPGYMVQQRIIPKLVDGKKYWDVRAFVINGKFIGAVKRVSRKKVTNLARGAKGDMLEKNLQKKLRPIAEKIVKTINKEAEEMAKNSFSYILEPEIPTLREVRWHPMGEE